MKEIRLLLFFCFLHKKIKFVYDVTYQASNFHLPYSGTILGLILTFMHNLSTYNVLVCITWNFWYGLGYQIWGFSNYLVWG